MLYLPRLDLRRLYPFEALAEIFDFAAGLVQRVPEKTSTAKSDLLNSTADSKGYAFSAQDDCGEV